MDHHPIERFDPLLRNLLSWGLAYELEDGTWALRPEVAERLSRLAQLTRRPETAAVVYFGHFCAACRTAGPTRMHDGRYLCDACRRASVQGPGRGEEPAEREPRRQGGRHRVGDIAS
jgi:hypothetical protein